MRKTTLYAIASLILLFAAKMALAPTVRTAAIEGATQKAVKAPEKFVALKKVNVKWPAQKKIVPKKPAPLPRPVSKPKTSSSSRLTKKSGKSGGKLTDGYNIVGDFKCSVNAYLQHMRRKGAIVVAYDGLKKRIWELTSIGTVSPIKKLHGRFSPQSRRLTDDFPNKSRVRAAIIAQYGPGNYEILLLIPEELDLHIKTSIERILKNRVQLSELTAVHLTYQQDGSAFTTIIDWVLINGKKILIGKAFAL